MEATIESIKLAALAATGHSELNWDEWNWYYSNITGQPAPAPEDRGWSRTNGGSVLIGGKPNYPAETWYSSAFGSVRGPGANGNGAAGAGIMATLAQPSKAIAGFISGMLPENLKSQAPMIAAGALIVAALLIKAGGNVAKAVLFGAGAAGLIDAMQTNGGA